LVLGGRGENNEKYYGEYLFTPKTMPKTCTDLHAKFRKFSMNSHAWEAAHLHPPQILSLGASALCSSLGAFGPLRHSPQN